jgi:lysyl-tRNA synthetase class 2
LDERTRLRARRPALEARAAALSAVRSWFAREGFLEVETPARVKAPGQELHLDAVPAGHEPALDGFPRWLVTSPEYAMKRLCGAGFERIFQIGKCWRAGEQGAHHQPEFTMIEWYRAEAPLRQIADDCEALARVVAGALAAHLPSRVRADLSSPFRRLAMAELVEETAGVALDGDEPEAVLRDKVMAAGVDPRSAARWDDLFFQLWLDKVEPALATQGPTFVFDWPRSLAALARVKPEDPRLAERFELYAGGLELANAYGELTDAAEQRRRFLEENEARRALGKHIYPVDEELLTALQAMPPTAGVALGFDRLMMWAWGARDIREVMAFAVDEI